MRVGLIIHPGYGLDSVRFVARSLAEGLSRRHQIRYVAPEYWYAADTEQQRLLDELVCESDVLVGFYSSVAAALGARARVGNRVPFIVFLLGALPRGGFGLRDLLGALSSKDILVANCTADAELAGLFCRDADVRVVPFAYDERVFYPLPASERAAVRAKLGFTEEDRVVLYAGRITLEKNLHTVLRTFQGVTEQVPNARLVIAGVVQGSGFEEFGVVPVDLPSTLSRAARRLGLKRDRVRFVGHATGARLRELYNAADVKVNLTLHHDENFGLAQVEAMACGTPVVGTAWGGLKDTIVDGATGFRVSVVPTASGVKVSWWEALNRLVYVLSDSEGRARMRERCAAHATEHYSQDRYRQRLDGLLDEAVARRDEPARAISPTEFATEVWKLRPSPTGMRAMYRPGHQSFALYREMVTPFTGVSAASVPLGASLEPHQILSLATPLVTEEPGSVRADDPLYPFQLDVPREYLADFGAISSLLATHPALNAEALVRCCASEVCARAVLRWMLDSGLLLRSSPIAGGVRPEAVSARCSEVLFSTASIDRSQTDLMLF